MKRFFIILFAGISLFASCSKQGNEPAPPIPVKPDIPAPSDGKFTLPAVRLTFSGVLDLENYCSGNFVILDPDKHYSETDDLRGSMRIRGRGNSTWGMPKKPVKLKFDTKSEVLGMPAEKDWALLANYADKSLLRNSLGMEISIAVRLRTRDLSQ